MKRTALTPQVLAFLERDRIATLNLVGILRNEPGTEILVDDADRPQGVLAKTPWFWYVHTEDEGFLEMLFREMDRNAGFHRFAGVWHPLAERIKARYPLVWDAPCDLYHLPPGNHRPELARHRARAIDLRDAEIVDAHYAYRNAHSLEKIRTCIQARNSSAIYLGDRIVCWLLVHEDDSLGIMYTLEEHRRKGYAVDVTVDLVGKQLRDGRTPYLQIRTDNSMSPGLARACGFVRQGNCDWFGVVAGIPPELIEGCKALRRRFLAALGEAAEAAVCLGRFLCRLDPVSGGEDPVAEAEDPEEWFAFASKQFREKTLRASVAALGKDCRLVCQRRGGAIRAAAAFLLDGEDGFELLWPTHGDRPFLLKALHLAREMGLDMASVHVSVSEQAPFEALGFRKIYDEERS